MKIVALLPVSPLPGAWKFTMEDALITGMGMKRSSSTTRRTIRSSADREPNAMLRRRGLASTALLTARARAATGATVAVRRRGGAATGGSALVDGHPGRGGTPTPGCH